MRGAFGRGGSAATRGGRMGGRISIPPPREKEDTKAGSTDETSARLLLPAGDAAATIQPSQARLTRAQRQCREQSTTAGVAHFVFEQTLRHIWYPSLQPCLHLSERSQPAWQDCLSFPHVETHPNASGSVLFSD